MNNVPQEKWAPCSIPDVLDTIRWREPVWDKPNKPRGKPDKIGEQLVTAKLLTMTDPVELQVIDVKRLSLKDGATDTPSKIKKNDKIFRKVSSIKNGDCEKLLQDS